MVQSAYWFNILLVPSLLSRNIRTMVQKNLRNGSIFCDILAISKMSRV